MKQNAPGKPVETGNEAKKENASALNDAMLPSDTTWSFRNDR